MRPLRTPAVALGVFYLLAIMLLGPLLGSSADASTAYAEHFGDDSTRVRDLAGSLALVVAAGLLGWTTVAARRTSGETRSSIAGDLTAAAGLVSASVIVVAAGLLAAVPVTTAIGDLTDDPGIDSAVQAGIAQGGTVVLLVGALALAVTTVLLARVGQEQESVPRWVAIAAWVTAGTLLLGVSVVLLVPFAAWSIALGLTWSSSPSESAPTHT